MGFSWSGICYADEASALSAFSKSIPSVDGGAVLGLAASPSINSAGLVSYSVRVHILSSNAVQVRSNTVQLTTCNAGMDQYSLQIEVFIAALFFAAFLGFRSGFRP